MGFFVKSDTVSLFRARARARENTAHAAHRSADISFPISYTVHRRGAVGLTVPAAVAARGFCVLSRPPPVATITTKEDE